MCIWCELLYVYRVQAAICVHVAICCMCAGCKLLYVYKVQSAVCVHGAS